MRYTFGTFFKNGRNSVKLGKTNMQISNLGLGCMSMSEFYGKPLDEKTGIQLIAEAYKRGINHFDTADVYGYGRNEILVGKAVATLIKQDVPREKLVIATKCGILRDEFDTTKRGVDNSYEYIKSACAASLNRLGKNVEYIDLFYIHRIANKGAQIQEAMKAMAELLAAGKIRAVGLSEPSSEILIAANNELLKLTQGKHQIAAVQSEYSLLTRVSEENGVLKTCRELGISFVAYSPLSRALLTGEFDTQSLEKDDFRRSLPRFQEENLEHNKAIAAKVKQIAEKRTCTTAQVALAWLIAQGVSPIFGTTKEDNLKSNILAMSLELSAQELTELNSLAGAKGLRYTETAMKAYGFDQEIHNEVPRCKL